ncbi:hypothetical protein AMJ57_02820, partial [Parcubacteria bacterium SG8_24]
MRRSYVFIAIVILLATSLLIVFGLSALPRLRPTDAEGESVTGRLLTPLSEPTYSFINPTRGMVNAPLTIYQFSDYTCSACASMEPVLEQILSDYQTQVRLVWKDFPHVGLQQESINAAMAARCAGLQGAFWEYHDLLLAEGLPLMNLSSYVALAAQLNVDLASFENCLGQEQTRAVVERDFEEGLRLNIDATPYFFIGQRRVSGGLTYEQMAGFIRHELDR